MKRNGAYQAIMAVVLILLLAGCVSSSLGHYTISAICSSYFGLGSTAQMAGYPIPLVVQSADMSVEWHDGRNSFILNDENTSVQTIALSGEVETQYDSGVGLALSEAHDLIATNDSVTRETAVRVYSLNESGLPGLVTWFEGLSWPQWHPQEPLLAAVVFEDSSRFSNQLAVIDVFSSADADRWRIFTLPDLAIGDNFGWSPDGQVVAVTQFAANGLVPSYLFVEQDQHRASLFESSGSCAIGGRWAPNGHSLAFSGRNRVAQDWDIFLETVDGLDSGSLVNLTNTNEADEISVAWSPDARKIAYAKAYLNPSGTLQQELVLMNLESEPPETMLLTDTLLEFETRPMWISENEIGYFSWVPSQSKWYLKRLSMADATEASKTVLELPKSWYRLP